MTKYDPEQWLETTVRCMKEYLEQEFSESVSDGSMYVGDQVYEIVAEFPGPALDMGKIPLHRTVIHFEIDDIISRIIGFGDGVLDSTYDNTTGQVTGRTGEVHRIFMDVGIWAFDASGGTTSRLRAKQILQSALGGARGIKRVRSFSDGGDSTIDVIGFSGGHFILDKVNDMTCYRMVDCNLELRVFSRDPLRPDMTGPAIEEIIIDPNMKVDENGTLIDLNDGPYTLQPRP